MVYVNDIKEMITMQKIERFFITMFLSLSLLITLAGCGKAPDPTIKEGRFDFSVTYEMGGEVKTLSSVYVCEFEESGMLLDGWYITT